MLIIGRSNLQNLRALCMRHVGLQSRSLGFLPQEHMWIIRFKSPVTLGGSLHWRCSECKGHQVVVYGWEGGLICCRAKI